MPKRLTLISPRIAVQKGDFLGSGIPYWPLELATLAAFLRERGRQVSVLDLLGSGHDEFADRPDHYLQGRDIRTFAKSRAVTDAEGFIVYAMSYMSHDDLLRTCRWLKESRPGVPVAVLENSQAVTAYSLQRMARPFLDAGADALICGEPYFNWDDIEKFLDHPGAGQPPPNVVCSRSLPGTPPHRQYLKDAAYPVPAWDLFNVEGYWRLPYAHGPKTGRFLPILTSRGCPYPCDFCVVPETNDRRWRGNDPVRVADEILALRDRFRVTHFHIEDLNPTVRRERFYEICRELIARKAGVFLYIVSGTKAETIDVEQVPLLAEAGCRYISISPESGSSEVMRTIGKPFDYDHARELVAACRRNGIRTQACFLVGHPAETEESFRQSRRYLQELVRAGLDEVAVFVVASFAGSAIYARKQVEVADAEALPSFSPKGRAGFEVFARRRRRMIRTFFLEKLKRGPDLWLQGLRALFGRPQTKMENLPRRILYVLWLIARMRARRLMTRNGAQSTT